LCDLVRIDRDGRHGALGDVEVVGVCDVRNVLLGEDGAAAVYGPNKGLDAEGVKCAEDGLAQLAEVVRRDFGREVADVPGAGAAGGLGAGLLAFTGARLVRGIDWVLDTLDVDAVLRDADLVITGEGKLDRESAFGKVVAGVSERAHQARVPVVAVAGVSELSQEQAGRMRLRRVFPIVRAGTSSQAAQAQPRRELERLVAEVAADLKAAAG
jgi:glycerate kinase